MKGRLFHLDSTFHTSGYLLLGRFSEVLDAVPQRPIASLCQPLSIILASLGVPTRWSTRFLHSPRLGELLVPLTFFSSRYCIKLDVGH